MGKLEERLVTVPGALEEFRTSHEAYAVQRWALLTKEHKDLLSPGMESMLRHSGIAGTDYRSFSIEEVGRGRRIGKPSIKCLHAHYAHYRSQMEESLPDSIPSSRNIVGKWVHELLIEEHPDLVL